MLFIFLYFISMLSTVLLTFREVLEAVLVVGIVVTFLTRLGHFTLRRFAWAGVLAGTLAALTVGAVIISTIGEIPESVEPLFEGVLMLIAAALVTTMIIWVLRAENMNEKIQYEMHAHLSTGATLGIVSLTFLAVFREGVELAIFLLAAKNIGATDLWLGFTLGLVGAVTLGVLFFHGLARASIRVFFRVTNVLLILFAAGILAHGVHELQEIGWFPFLTATAYDLRDTFSDAAPVGHILRALLGYNDNPSWLETIAYVGYLVPMGWLIAHPARKK